jgi:hypothetical protein
MRKSADKGGETMRRLFLGLAAVLGLSAAAPSARAQFDFSDPMFLYYGWYLPRQAALAAQPRVEDTINAISANRQLNAMTNRSGLFEPSSLYDSAFDPNNPFGARTGSRQAALMARTGVMTNHINGAGPARYYNRAAQYYPSLVGHTGRAVARRGSAAPMLRGRGRGITTPGVGMPGTGMGVPF